MTLRWTDDHGSLRCTSDGRILFEDSLDHWNHGVCRLLGLADEEGRRWVETVLAQCRQLGADLTELSEEDVARALRRGWDEFRGASAGEGEEHDLRSAPPMLGLAADKLFASHLSSAPHLMVIGSVTGELGWLVARASLKPPTEGTAYDNAYFEGVETGVGYGGYLEQESWRMEKSRRFLRRIQGAATLLGLDLPKRPALLDVGAGYGFFRQAAEESGWDHVGVEVSHHASGVGERLFGFSSFVGDLDEFSRRSDRRFNVLTMWDVLEHVADPTAILKVANSLLHPGGALFIRTPNLLALERDVFGPEYHSFKAEHLFYFGPRTLLDILHASGFSVALLLTESHLLRGFLGPRLENFERLLRGSDFFAVAVKPPASS